MITNEICTGSNLKALRAPQRNWYIATRLRAVDGSYKSLETVPSQRAVEFCCEETTRRLSVKSSFMHAYATRSSRFLDGAADLL
jgi:hypothetical protein